MIFKFFVSFLNMHYPLFFIILFKQYAQALYSVERRAKVRIYKYGFDTFIKSRFDWLFQQGGGISK